MSVEINHPESTIPASRFAFKGMIAPTKAEMEAIPHGSHVLLVTWPDEPPTIAGIIWDESGRESYLGLIEKWDSDSIAADVAIFHIAPTSEEDDIVRRAMDLPADSVLSELDRGRPVYSEQDVADMIATALRLQATPF